MQDQEYHDSFMPPTPTEIQTPPVVSDTALGQVVLAANVCITAIIVVAMLIDGTTARTAIIAGSAYFAVSTIAFAGVTTGAITSIINAYQVQRTERERIRAYLALGTQHLSWRLALTAPLGPQGKLERNRIGDMSPIVMGHVPSPEGVQRVSPLTLVPNHREGTFVAPYADEARAAREAVAWAERLYSGSAPHAPDPRRVHPDGRLKIRMLASKRGHGNREAGVWLIKRGVIVRVAGGYSLNLNHYPYRHYVTALA